MSGQTPFRTELNLSALAGFDLTITFNGLVAVRHVCGAQMILPAGDADLPSAVQGALDHDCRTQPVLIDRMKSHVLPVDEDEPDESEPEPISQTAYFRDRQNSPTDQELIDRNLMHRAVDGTLTFGPAPVPDFTDDNGQVWEWNGSYVQDGSPMMVQRTISGHPGMHLGLSALEELNPGYPDPSEFEDYTQVWWANAG